MSIEANITREDFSYRGGGVELDLTAFGYEDEFPERLPELLRRWDVGGVLAIAVPSKIGGWMKSSSDSPRG